MGLTIIEEFLGPPPPGQAAVYTIDTRTRVRVPQGEMRHGGSTVVQHKVLETRPTGYLIELVTLEQRLHEPNALAELLLDIARANSPLHIETDTQGNFLRVVNKPTLRAQWQEAAPWLRAKYQHLPGSAAMLAQVAGQYDAGNDHLEQALACKGSCGMLLPGVYGLRPLHSEERASEKTLHQFFRAGALPLHVAWTSHAADTFAREAEVTGTGRLDASRFDAGGFYQELHALLPGPPARPSALHVQWQAHYTLSRAGQGLLAGRQWLRATVPGLYDHETEHTLRPGATLPAAQS
jgi:hypothetical protein